MSESIETTSMWQEIQDIVRNTSMKGLVRYTATIHTEKEDFPVWKILTLERVRNYAEQTAEYVNLQIRMGAGDYMSRLYPYRENLELTLRSSAVKSGTSKGRSKGGGDTVVRYKAVFNPNHNPPVTAGDLEQADPELLNNSDVLEVDLQLYDRSLEVLRVATTVVGSFQNQNPKQILEALLPMECSQMLVEGKPVVDAFDIVEPDNEDALQTAMFPHGLPILSIPTYMQEKLTGVYGRGIGTFLQYYNDKRTLFIYPLFDSERFDTAARKAMFFMVPQDKLPQLDKSYWLDGDTLKVAVTGARRYNDSAGINEINTGSGYRTTDAGAIMTKPVKVTQDGQVIAQRANLNHEVVYKERPDGLNYAPMTSRPSSNTFNQRSEILRTTMAQFDLVWENADPMLIYPGMPCECVYISQGKPVSLKGTVLLVHSMSNADDDHVFRTVTRVSVAVLPRKDKPELPKGAAAHDTILSRAYN